MFAAHSCAFKDRDAVGAKRDRPLLYHERQRGGMQSAAIAFTSVRCVHVAAVRCGGSAMPARQRSRTAGTAALHRDSLGLHVAAIGPVLGHWCWLVIPCPRNACCRIASDCSQDRTLVSLSVFVGFEDDAALPALVNRGRALALVRVIASSHRPPYRPSTIVPASPAVSGNQGEPPTTWRRRTTVWPAITSRDAGVRGRTAHCFDIMGLKAINMQSIFSHRL